MTTPHVYHYWNGKDWIAFFLEAQYAPQWNELCQRLMITSSEKRPDWNDYIEFKKKIYGPATHHKN